MYLNDNLGKNRVLFAASLAVTFVLLACQYGSLAYAERIKDLATIEGVRTNALIGYGFVVGLNGTGDSSTASPFTVNSLNSMLERFGINIRSKLSAMKPDNSAAVVVTGTLPAFAKPGQKMDITVSSIGDAESLRGGTLLLTPLTAGNGQVYAIGQGALTVGGISAGGKASSKTVNHPTVGRIPNGAHVERAAPASLPANQKKITLALNIPDFTTVKRMQDAINENFGANIAKAIDAAAIEVWNPEANTIELIARLEQIELETDHPAVVVLDERTGTIVMGQEVRIDTVAVAHGNISVTVTESPQVSQPNAFAGGQTAIVDRTDIQVEEEEARLVVLPKKVSLSDLVAALNAVGATASDLISVLQAIKAAGALHAELRVI